MEYECFFCGKPAKFSVTITDQGNCPIGERDMCAKCIENLLVVNADDMKPEIDGEKA